MTKEGILGALDLIYDIKSIDEARAYLENAKRDVKHLTELLRFWDSLEDDNLT